MVVEVALVIITSLAVVVALFGKNFLDWWNRPIIKVGFGNQNPYSLDSYSSGAVINLLFRLKIVNLGKIVAKNCRVRLLSVKSNEEENVLDKNEPDILRWSSSPRDMRYRVDPERDINSLDKTQLTPIFREHKDITPNRGWEFCDLFNIDSRQKKVTFASLGNRSFFAGNEEYIATIEISGDNFEPVKKEVKFITPCKVDVNTLAIVLAGIKCIKNISQ